MTRLPRFPLLISIIFALTWAVVPVHALAEESCARTATVNYQKVLIDTNSVQKGEGLRYYLEKDPVAKSYFDKYQDETDMKWQSAVAGTIGTGVILTTILSKNGRAKTGIIVGGLALIAVNFLVARTLEYSNETYLQSAVEEYNKRNLPKIYLDSQDNNEENSPAVQLEWSKDF